MPKTPVIAIVDDDKPVRESTMDLVKSLGFAAKGFPSAEAFLKATDARNASLLIADMRMSGMSGLELHIRLSETAHPIPTILATAFPNDRSPDRRLRIGYVSPDFRQHPVGRFLIPLFRNHDHSQFEVYSYSGVQAPDEMTAQLRSFSDHWRNTVPMSDAELSDIVAYIRSLPALDAAVPGPRFGPVGTVLLALGKFPLSAEHQPPLTAACTLLPGSNSRCFCKFEYAAVQRHHGSTCNVAPISAP